MITWKPDPQTYDQALHEIGCLEQQVADLQEQLAEAHEYIANADEEQRQWMNDLYDAADEIERLKKIVAALAVPVGWKLVPVRPTHEMLEAANLYLRREYTTLGLGEGSHLDATKAASNYYAAMLAAAPELTPNAPHEGADAALSRTLPLDAVVGPRIGEKE